MSTIIEVDENGTLHLPASLLPEAGPHARYRIEVDEKHLVLSREDISQPLWKTATPDEWAAGFLEWADSHTPGAGLSDEAVSRDSIYD